MATGECNRRVELISARARRNTSAPDSSITGASQRSVTVGWLVFLTLAFGK